jgi:radical SAM/Cys-rich protein
MIRSIRQFKKILKSNYNNQLCLSSTRTSLIPETLQDIENDINPTPPTDPAQSKRLSLEERKKRMRTLTNLNIPPFKTFLQEKNLSITRKPATIMQLNIGLYCNQACKHCHVESSPKRTEAMNDRIYDQIFQIIDNSPSITTLDITGGAPELIYGFRSLVKRGRERNLEVIDRCNLTVLCEPGQEDLHIFLAENKVRIVASLPCYSEKNVNLQRGAGVFARSIEGLQLLNSAGYGKDNSGLHIDLMYNPGGAFLPPNQASLERDYKDRLKNDFNIEFNNLFTLTNMPIKRFADQLYKANKLESYMQLLVNNFNPAALSGLMCRDTVSVNYDGYIFDCDFNQQLNIPLGNTSIDNNSSKSLSIFDIKSVNDLMKYNIALEDHCFGCTAGTGSSCQGATVKT